MIKQSTKNNTTNKINDEEYKKKMELVFKYSTSEIQRGIAMYERHKEYMRNYQRKVTTDPEKAQKRREKNREASKIRMRRIRAEEKEIKLLATFNEEQKKRYFLEKELKELQQKELDEKLKLLDEDMEVNKNEENEEYEEYGEYDDLD